MLFTMMIGLDGSGRSECAAQCAKMVVQDEREALKALEGGMDVALDGCNLSARQRKAMLERIKKTGCTARAVVCARRVADCILSCPDRREEIWKQYLAFTPPQAYEGWDRIELRYAEDTQFTSPDELFYGKDGLIYFAQDNPYHTHSVGMHCIYAARNAARLRPDDPAMWLAALLHDIGKAQTKSFTDSHGNPSSTAHYYGHELASAYESLFVAFPRAVPETERLRVSAMIAWHMTPFHFTNEKTRSRYLRLWGEEFLRDMLIIERSDREAQR